MKRKWVKGVVAAGVIGCLLAGCASEKTAHLDGLDKLGAIKVVAREEGSGTRSTFAEKAGIVDDATGMNSIFNASKVRSFPVKRSPTPIRYLMASIACKDPMTPPIAPMTPACLQVGTASFGGGFLNTQR